MQRITRDALNMDICELIAQRSICQRGKNAAVITLNHRIISTGYNGPIVKGSCNTIPCDLSKGCVHSAHAEANAIFSAARNGIRLVATTLYCTSAPCYNCALAIVQAGITRVVYKNEYRLRDGLYLLQDFNHIQINHYTDTEEERYEQI